MVGSPEFDALLAALTEGTLDAAGRSRLQEILRADAGARRFYLEYCQMHALLRSAHGALQAMETPARRRLRRWIPAAAAVLIAAAAFAYFRTSSGLEGSVSGPAWVLRDGEQRKADGLRVGDRLVTGLEAPAELRLADGTRLQLQAASQIQLDRVDQRPRVLLHEGTLHGEIAKQPPGRPMLFATSFAEASVLGTSFDLATDRSETRLLTRSGRMRFRSGTRSVEVAAGELATADARAMAKWAPLCDWTFAGMTALPPELELLFCPSRILHDAGRTVTAAPDRATFVPAGLVLSGMPGPQREHGLAVARWKGEAGDDLILEADVAGGETWSLGFALSGDSFEGFRVIFAVMEDYPNGIAVDTIHPVNTVVLARDPRRIPHDVDHLLRVEYHGRRIRIWVDRELRIDTVLEHPLPEGRRRSFGLSNFGSPPVIRAFRAWKKVE